MLLSLRQAELQEGVLARANHVGAAPGGVVDVLVRAYAIAFGTDEVGNGEPRVVRRCGGDLRGGRNQGLALLPHHFSLHRNGEQ